MGPEKHHSTGDILRFEAKNRLSETENVDNALHWIRNNPESLTKRISEFDQTTGSLNDLLQTDAESIDPGRYSNVIKLKGQLPESGQLPTMDRLVKESNPRFEGKRTIEYDVIESVYKEMDRLIKEKEWQFPTQTANAPNIIASGLLIEGYGLLLEKHLDTEDLARTYVLAFEEVLFENYHNSELLEDVAPWMLEDISDFSPIVSDKLRQYQKEINLFS